MSTACNGVADNVFRPSPTVYGHLLIAAPQENAWRKGARIMSTLFCSIESTTTRLRRLTLTRSGWFFLLVALLAATPGLNAQTQIQVFGLWHCYSDACSWASVPNMTTFDTDNHWIIDRGNGSPSANLVVLSFVNPVKLMNLTNDSATVNGIPIGMSSAVVNYFTSHGIRVMMSIGGFSYTKDWDKALGSNPTQLGINAANAAKQFDVGMEIDYEKSSNPNLTGLQQFVSA